MNTSFAVYRLVPLTEPAEPVANEKPLEAVASNSTALPTTSSAPTTIDAAINALPVRYRPRAKLLMKKLQLNGFIVNDFGEISFEGRDAPGSRIFELIPVVVKESLRNLPETTGLNLMSFAIFQSSIPLRLLSTRFLKYHKKQWK